MTNTEIAIKKQIRFIYTKIADLRAHDPRRTTKDERDIKQCGESRCYMLVQMCEALAEDGIITKEKNEEVFRQCQDALRILTELSNGIYRRENKQRR